MWERACSLPHLVWGQPQKPSDFLTLGQYLQPTPRHATVEDFVTPQVFDAFGAVARAKGFLLVASSPLTRSSYHAGDDFAKMKAAREAKLAQA